MPNIVRQSADLVKIKNSPNGLLVNLIKTIFQTDGFIENNFFRGAVIVNTEISMSLELIRF